MHNQGTVLRDEYHIPFLLCESRFHRFFKIECLLYELFFMIKSFRVQRGGTSAELAHTRKER